MIYLANGCTCTALQVFPKNWQTKQATCDMDWYIFYRFYDPAFRSEPKYKTGKLVIIKAGLNRFKQVHERRSFAKALIEQEMQLLQVEGFNPITRHKLNQAAIDDYGKLSICDALDFAFHKKQLEPHTTEDVRSMLKYVKAAIVAAGISQLPIKETERKHIKLILDLCGKTKERWSNNTFNHYRKYLNLLFAELVQYDAIGHNPVTLVQKMKTTVLIRKTLTLDERKKVNVELKAHHYPFWRFLQIFFHSGARETEMVRLKAKHVDLSNQRFLVLVKKGKEFREVWKPIKRIVLPLWQELMAIATPNCYLFGEGLLPEEREKPIRPEQITRRWKRHVKLKMGIEADFYSLKHLNTDETAALLDIEAAALQNSHTSTVITLKHYAHGEKSRQMEKLKKLSNSFA